MRWFKLVLAVVLVLALGATLVLAKPPKSKIVTGSNKHHDLRSVFNSASFTACSYCHVAHKTGDAPTGPGYLLWNHTLSSVASYGVYQSDSLNATDVTDLGTSGGSGLTVSNLCLSCHDGTVAINSFYSPITKADFSGPIPEGTTFMSQGERIRDLSKTHPVNFTYNAAVAAADGGLLTPASSKSVDAAGEIPLYNSKMQCATCHDPHNGDSGIFARVFPTQATGSFCTYCHL